MKKVILLAMIYGVLAGRVEAIDPQYVFVNKSTADNRTCCVWNPSYPNSINQGGIDELVREVGSKGNDQRRLGIELHFDYHNNLGMDKLKQSLNNLLALSEKNEVPILIALDGFENWEFSPELWNWWDPNKLGYNPANKENVEWTGWDSSQAIKISWRNWDVQRRTMPHPNIMSPVFINSSNQKLNQLVPIIVNWYNSLPQNKKYLLGGVIIGWEVNIGRNFYYYPNGNNMLTQPETSDPNYHGTNVAQQLSSSMQLGYAAVKTAGIKSSGALTADDLTEVVIRYLDTLAKTAYDLGLPREKMYTHVGPTTSTDLPGKVWTKTKAAVLNYASPGWSMYAKNFTWGSYEGFSEAFNMINNANWSASEWLYEGTDFGGWKKAMDDTLGYRNNRLLSIYNWEGIRGIPNALSAIKTALNERPQCWVEVPDLNMSWQGDEVKFLWSGGGQVDDLHLLVTNSKERIASGLFKTVNLVNEKVVGRVDYVKTGLGAGKAYAILVADGCGNQRRVGRMVEFSKGDANGDGVVNIVDFVNWQKEYVGQSITKTADFNNDTKVNMSDFVIWRNNYGK